MRCNHCNKTIPEVSINCPFCKEIVDPDAKPVVNFGELNVTDYDSRFDIKANNYEEVKEKKKTNPWGICGIAGGVVLVLVIVVVIMLSNSTASGYTYFKNVNDTLFTFLLDNYTSSNDTKSGIYDLYFKINDHEYEFEGNYGIDTKNKIVKVTGEYQDPRHDTGQIVVTSNVLKFDAYLENNYFYLLSEQIYDRNKAIMLPIDDETGLLKTKKYDLESLLNGVYDALDYSLSKAKYKYEENVEIAHLGVLTNVSSYTIVLDNAGKKDFLVNFFQTLIDDGSFIGDYAKIQNVSSDEAVSILENYKTKAEYKYSGDSDKVTNLTIYFDKTKVYRLEVDVNENSDRLLQIDIGDTKYYLEYYENNKNVYSGSLKFSTEEKEKHIVKEYDITFDSDKFVTDIMLHIEQSKSPMVKKNKYEEYKEIKDFEDADFNKVKSNLRGFFPNVGWVENLQDVFKEKCSPALKCECKVNSKNCSCIYNGNLISCPANKVKKPEPVTTTTTTTTTTTSTRRRY